jgi:hypothetical protein
VHAVVAGVIMTVGGQGALELRGADGTDYRYLGLDADSIAVGVGSTVAAGDIVGAVGAEMIELRVFVGDGSQIDAVDALVGLADPNELGYAAVGSTRELDPDEMDRAALAAGLPGPEGAP